MLMSDVFDALEQERVRKGSLEDDCVQRDEADNMVALVNSAPMLVTRIDFYQ